MAPAPADISRILLRPVATPLPLGFLALAAATSEVSAVQLGWVPMSEAKFIGLALLVAVAPLQLLCAILGYLARDPVAATGMGVLAGTWAVIGAAWHGSGASPTPVLGTILIIGAGSLLVPIAAGLSGKVIAGLVMLGAAARFALTAAFELGISPTVDTAAGWLGIALAVLAWYAAMALEVEALHQKAVLPTFRVGAAKRAMSSSLADEIDVVGNEPGVRQQL
ncbi:MAG TPA: hypothetical protein VG435_21145 [Acidimicrobiales bacterium]|jgi:hypothetical protein|nr:hypothetical protein [Acidimicrobiales bacterium]